ncbi:MAG: glycosyltransferase [Lacunisphaera sp.]
MSTCCGYDHEFVPNVARDPGTHHFAGLHNPALRGRLQAWAPGAILLFGYAYRTHLGLILRPPAPLIFRGDSHLIDQQPSVVKSFVLRRLYSRFAAITYVGQANRDYFRHFGVPEGKLHFAPHCVDASRFTRTATVEAAAERLRTELGLGCRQVVLFAGKFIPDKQPLELLEAFLTLAPADAALVFVGDGTQRTALEERARARPDCVVRFLPFANQSEMPVRYALARLFVLPSRGLYETWGLAVNEAMHLGVPCLVSDRVGCQRDLVTEGETGWVFRTADPAALRSALERALVAVRGDLSAMHARIAARIAGLHLHRRQHGTPRGLRAGRRPAMKITIVSGFFLPTPPVAGGAMEKMWWRLARLYVQRGHEVTILCRRWQDWPVEAVVEGVRIVRLPGFNHRRRLWQNLVLDAVWGLKMLTSLPAADILITNTVALPVFVRALRPRAGRLVVNLNRFPKGQLRWYRDVARLQAGSASIAAAAAEQAPALASVIRVVPNSIDCSAFAGPARPRSAAKPVVIGFIGRINPRKVSAPW